MKEDIFTLFEKQQAAEPKAPEPERVPGEEPAKEEPAAEEVPQQETVTLLCPSLYVYLGNISRATPEFLWLHLYDTSFFILLLSICLFLRT